MPPDLDPYRSAEIVIATPLTLAREEQRADATIFTLAWTRGFPVGFAILFLFSAFATVMVFTYPHASNVLRVLMIAPLVWLLWQIYDRTFARPELGIESGGVVTVRSSSPPRKLKMQFLAIGGERLPALAVELADGKRHVVGPMFRSQQREDVDALLARMNAVLGTPS